MPKTYALEETDLSPSGLFRCCIDTILTLPDQEYQDGTVIDCKHEAPGNKRIVLKDGIWRWNQDAP